MFHLIHAFVECPWYCICNILAKIVAYDKFLSPSAKVGTHPHALVHSWQALKNAKEKVCVREREKEREREGLAHTNSWQKAFNPASMCQS